MEIRALVGEDGEEYLNAKDLVCQLEKAIWYMPTPSISVLNFVRRFVINLITARRDS